MAVNPGPLPLSITRGIAFSAVILRCVDNGVAVTGALNPNVTGTFQPSGQFAGYDLFILPGAPSTFLYFNAIAASYVIARLLTTAALTDYWSPAAPLTEPTGTYVAHGANTGTATADDHPVDLTGITPEAVVRRTDESDVVLDLNPSVTNATTGQITIPAMTTVTTKNIDSVGTFGWDLVLVNGSGDRFGPYVAGPFVITDNITQPEP
jgi:hypothetical protein